MATLNLSDEVYKRLKDGEQRVIAPGMYRFVVKSVDLSTAEATENRPRCQQLTVNLSLIPLSGDDRGKLFTDRLYLTTKLFWKASEFFESIGGIDTVTTEEKKLNTDRLVGHEGLCEVSKRVTGTSSQNQRAWTEVAYKPYDLYKAYRNKGDNNTLPPTLEEMEEAFGEINVESD